MEWSRFVQSARCLDVSRKQSLRPELRPLIIDWLGIKAGNQILDVGCGSGALTRYLVDGKPKIHADGIDLDKELIESAQATARMLGLQRRLHFAVGDACALPYADNTFDLVVSHTVLGVVPDPATTLAEMMRVTKSGGRVAAIDAMHSGDRSDHPGYYPVAASWRDRLQAVEPKVWEAFDRVLPLSSIQVGLRTSEIPHFFATRGLKNVRIHAFAHAFSLSDAGMSQEDKREYIEAMYEDLVAKTLNYWSLPEVQSQLDQPMIQEYIDALTEKRDNLLARIGENVIWDWQGGSKLVVIGDVEK